jgi:hypothetical protein
MVLKMVEKTSAVYPTLYHYTKYQSITDILESNILWANKYLSLNDLEEIKLFRKKVPDILKPEISCLFNREQRREIKNFKSILEEEIKIITDCLYGATGHEIYITSFCGEHKDEYPKNNGFLSQWRGYGKDGGCVIVFDTLKLEEMLIKDCSKYGAYAHISDVVYDGDEQSYSHEFSENIKHIAQYGKELVESNFYPERYKKKKYPDAKEFLPSWIQCITRFKHEGFQEEKEVRVVVEAMKASEEIKKQIIKEGKAIPLEWDIKHRIVEEKEVDYIELFSSLDMRSAIKKIIIGPHKEKDSRADILRRYIKDRKYNIEVTVSETPYV